jgi:hypothetical protein
MRLLSPRFVLVTIAALTLLGGVATSAHAASTAIPGSPLTVHVGDRGQLQAFRTGQESGIFFRPDLFEGDAGFFLAFPDATQMGLTGKVFGFEGWVGPTGLEAYHPVSQGPVTGTGTAGDPLTQVTTYEIGGSMIPEEPCCVLIEQTTTYVNGAQQFTVRWDVTNNGGVPLKFKALAAADFFFEGDDAGTGIFTQGPPRFIGGTNADSGNSGGFLEVLGSPSGSQPWSAYQALPFGFGPDQVWGKVQAAGDSTSASFDNSVLAEATDNAGGVEWDQAETTPLANGATRSFELVVLSAVPAALQISPSNAVSRQGVPVNLTVTGLDTNGQPYAGKTLRYEIKGANVGSGSATTDAAGSAVVTDPGTNAGADTVVVYLDFNNDGTRDEVEPQASALASFVDSVPPSCTLKVSGTLIGGGSGKPLVINVDCGEGATVKVQTTLSPVGGGKASAKPRKHKRKHHKKKVIKLKPSTVTVSPGQPAAVSVTLPKSVKKKYAGKTLRATIVATARDNAGNVNKTTATHTIKVPKAKKHKHRHRRVRD